MMKFLDLGYWYLVEDTVCRMLEELDNTNTNTNTNRINVQTHICSDLSTTLNDGDKIEDTIDFESDTFERTITLFLEELSLLAEKR